jgi:hypothetical protein
MAVVYLRGHLVPFDPHSPPRVPGPIPAAISMTRGLDSARAQLQLFGSGRGPTAPVDDRAQLMVAAAKSNPARGITPRPPAGPIARILGSTAPTESTLDLQGPQGAVVRALDRLAGIIG